MPDDMNAPGPYGDELVCESAGLAKTTNWWSAFVIGLAGTILVTGIAPAMVTALGIGAGDRDHHDHGLSGLPAPGELSAMMPDRSGGLPAYAYPAYKEKWPRFAEHVNGFTAWAYWLGWFPMAPLNMILASLYIAERFKLTGGSFSPLGTPITWWTLGISHERSIADNRWPEPASAVSCDTRGRSSRRRPSKRTTRGPPDGIRDVDLDA